MQTSKPPQSPPQESEPPTSTPLSRQPSASASTSTTAVAPCGAPAPGTAPSPSAAQLSFPVLKHDSAYVDSLAGHVILAFGNGYGGPGYYAIETIALNAQNRHFWNDYRLGRELNLAFRRLTGGRAFLSPKWQRKLLIVQVHDDKFCTRVGSLQPLQRALVDRLMRLCNDCDSGVDPRVRARLETQHRWVDWLVDFSEQNPGFGFEYQGGASLTAFTIVVAFVAVGAMTFIIAAFVIPRGVIDAQTKESIRQTWLSLSSGWLGVGSLMAAGVAVVGLAQDA